MSFVNTTDVLNALQASLAALKFPAGAAPWADTALFQSVRMYDIPQLEDALTDLLEYQDRICLIVPMDETFTTVPSGATVTTQKSQDFLLLISDRDYAPGKGSYFGDATHPGVLLIKDLVVVGMLGATLGLPGVVLRPEGGQSIRIAASADTLTAGREGYRLFLRTDMGKETRNIERGRVVSKF